MSVTVAVGYFDGIEMTMDEPVTEPGAKSALEAFLRLTPADRIADSRHVYAYYRDFRELVGGEDWMDDEMGVPQTPQDIWIYVTPPQRLYLDQDYTGTHWYVSMTCGCGWEEEHGLMLVWREGARLTKVGGHDGRMTNAGAYDDQGLAEIVYHSSDPTYLTRLDP